MIRLLAPLCLLLCAALPSAAQEADAMLDIGGDAFRAGRTVTVRSLEVDDLFAAGATVRAATDVAGNAHLAGRKVRVEADVAGDLYAAGMEVTSEGAVAGDATLFGYDVTAGDVGGDLRASGGEVTVSGDVGGYALLAGDEVRIEGAIAGDAQVAAGRLDFGSGASIGGTLTLYEDEAGRIEVPEGIASAVVRRQVEEWDAEMQDVVPTRRSLFARFLIGVLMVTALAALVAAVLPETLARLRFTVLGTPLRSVWIGALTLSVLVGGAILSALTLIGLLAAPAFVLAAVVLGFVGYVVGVYAFGVAIVRRIGRGVPDDFGDRAVAAAAGALAAGVIALLPVLGWLFVLALALAGAGAVAIALVRPRFFTEV